MHALADLFLSLLILQDFAKHNLDSSVTMVLPHRFRYPASQVNSSHKFRTSSTSSQQPSKTFFLFSYLKLKEIRQHLAVN